MSTALAVQDGTPGTALAQRAPISLLRPIAEPAEVIEAQNATRAMVHEALKNGRDFGIIPGTDKPTMLKPGAERVALAFGCYYGEPEIITSEVDHDREVRWIKRKKKWNNAHPGDRTFTWEEEQGLSLGLYRYVVKVAVINRATGEIVGSGVGSCSSMESKYVDRPRDSENTILKMAHKRALVAACLVTFGLSDEFTQDVEDLPHSADRADDEARANGPASNEPDAKCPKCGGRMWDNRTSKTNPKAPDFKCRDKSCDGAYWPGQWPPAPLATDDQKARIVALLDEADLSDDAKNKTRRIVESTEKPLTAERAVEIITKLEPLAIAPQLPIEDGAAEATTAGSGGPVTMPKGGAVSDALTPKASGAGLTELTKKITALLTHEKFTEDERAQFKAKLAKADSIETMQLLVAEIETHLDLPF